jgi:hypothetical protein
MIWLSPKREFRGTIWNNFFSTNLPICIICRFTVSWLPPSPHGPHDRYKLQYKLFTAHPHDWNNIEVGSKELKCLVRMHKF